jgi:hypothetical protein
MRNYQAKEFVIGYGRACRGIAHRFIVSCITAIGSDHAMQTSICPDHRSAYGRELA